ncbi:MAG: AAA family ATPase [Dehalococcoidia bacterium]
MPWATFGQAKAVRTLSAAVADPAHAYLLCGPEGSGKEILAREFAQALLCTAPADKPCKICSACRRVEGAGHPDLVVLSPQGKLGYREEETEDIPAAAAVSPFEAPYKVFILNRVETLNRWGGNALLKVLEEPPATVVFLLLTSQPDEVIETIRSRCRLITLRPQSPAAIAETLRAEKGLTNSAAEAIAHLAAGRLDWALEAASDADLVDKRKAAVAAIVGLVEAPVNERFQWARRAAERFQDNSQVLYGELDLMAAGWRDLLAVIGERAAPSVTTGNEELVQRVARGLALGQATAALNAILSAKEALEANVNARLALESLMLALPHKDRP